MPEVTPNHRWTNWLDEREIQTTLVKPTSRRDLEVWMRSHADLRGLRARAGASGHSTSRVGQPAAGGHLVLLDDLVLDFEAEAEGWWKVDRSAVTPEIGETGEPVRVAAGTPLWHLNRELEARGRALENLGSYDRQTIGGVIATATHGSGLQTGPICDFVLSIELVAVVAGGGGEPEVRAFRIEPTEGLTDPTAFAAAEGDHGMELVQDDDTFHSAVVGLGAFGIVTAVTLRTVPLFWLAENRFLLGWEELRGNLEKLAREEGSYFDVTLVPNESLRHARRDRWCLATRRVITDPVSHPAAAPDRTGPRERQLRERIEKKFRHDPNPRLALTRDLAHLASRNPEIAAERAERVLGEEAAEHPFENPWKSVSHKVFRTSLGDLLLATSAEMAVPIAKAVTAIDEMLRQIDAMAVRRLPHTSPVGVRFTAASPHYLAPEFGRASCTLEAPLLVGEPGDPRAGTVARDTLLRAFHDTLIEKASARPHWGQLHWLDREGVAKLYPKFPTWLAEVRRFNAFGTFDNALLEAIGAAGG